MLLMLLYFLFLFVSLDIWFQKIKIFLFYIRGIINIDIIKGKIVVASVANVAVVVVVVPGLSI